MNELNEAELHKEHLYGAVDLGTNSCRLLIVKEIQGKFWVVDSYADIVRLGGGLLRNGYLSKPAQQRTLKALLNCAEKINSNNVVNYRCVATAACRAARNGFKFLEYAQEITGLKIEVISGKEEARLSL